MLINLLANRILCAIKLYTVAIVYTVYTDFSLHRLP